MVTNYNSEQSAFTSEHVQPDSFVGVLQRRSAGVPAERLMAERLAAWQQLGYELAGESWHWLEVAIDAAKAAVIRTRHHVPIPSGEAEELAARFAEDCQRIVDAGGAGTLWHVISADHETVHRDIDALCLSEDEMERRALAGELVDAARCYALAVFAQTVAPHEIENARMLFGADASVADVDAYAPFAVDNGDGNADRWRDAAVQFVTATSNADRLAAVADYAFGFEQQAMSFSLWPVQRLGLIAWLARRGIQARQAAL